MNNLIEALDKFESQVKLFCDKMKEVHDKNIGRQATRAEVDLIAMEFENVFNKYAPRIMVENQTIVTRMDPNNNYRLLVEIVERSNVF